MPLPSFLQAGQRRHYAEVLSLLGCEDDHECYVLGVHEGRVTLLSQQSRALNLAWALGEAGALQTAAGSPAPVAVVGAGAGGMTAAAALSCLGANVTLIGSSGELMLLQAGCKQRWLHPFIYDWPNEQWYRESAQLPILDWKAGTAESVRDQIIKGFDELRQSVCPSLECRLNTEVLALERERTGGYRLHLRSYSGALASLEASIVVFTVGFGVEDEPAGVPANAIWQSYWKTDLLGGSTGDVLVSGDGDGGLTDVLRCALKDFDHSDLLELAGHDAETGREKGWVGKVRREILDFEAKLTVGRVGPSSLEFYRDGLHGKVKELDDALQKSLNGDMAVTLNARGQPLRASASALNRLIVGRLLKLSERAGAVVSLSRVAIDLGTVRPPRTFRMDAKHALMVDGFSNPFDKMVIRHGTVEPRPIRAFPIRPTMAPALRSLPLAWALDQSRLEAWDPVAFLDCARGRPPTAPELTPPPARPPTDDGVRSEPVDVVSLTPVTRQVYFAVLLARRYGLGPLDIASVERVTAVPAWQVARLVGDELATLMRLEEVRPGQVEARLEREPAALASYLEDPVGLPDAVFADLEHVHSELGYEIAAVTRAWREAPGRHERRLKDVHRRLRFNFWYGVARGSLEPDALLITSLDALQLVDRDGEIRHDERARPRELVEVGLWAARRILRRGTAASRREALALLGRWHLADAINLVPAAPRNSHKRDRPPLSGQLIGAFAVLALSDAVEGGGFGRAADGVSTLARRAMSRLHDGPPDWELLAHGLDRERGVPTRDVIEALRGIAPDADLVDYIERVTGMRAVHLTFQGFEASEHKRRHR